MKLLPSCGSQTAWIYSDTFLQERWLKIGFVATVVNNLYEIKKLQGLMCILFEKNITLFCTRLDSDSLRQSAVMFQLQTVKRISIIFWRSILKLIGYNFDLYPSNAGLNLHEANIELCPFCSEMAHFTKLLQPVKLLHITWVSFFEIM
jgi:hypothetical protein